MFRNAVSLPPKQRAGVKGLAHPAPASIENAVMAKIREQAARTDAKETHAYTVAIGYWGDGCLILDAGSSVPLQWVLPVFLRLRWF